MSAQRLALNYARALLETVSEGGGNGADAHNSEGLRDVAASLKELSIVINESEQLYVALTSPQLPRAEKVKIAEEFCKKAQCGEILTRFVCLLAARDRVQIISEISERFSWLVDESQSVVRGVITTADAISSSQVKELELAFGKKLKKSVKLETKEDRTLLGGLVVRIGNLTFDGSLNTALNNIQNTLERQYV
jgi:F-type H+-transporting ATPase subunit delta